MNSKTEAKGKHPVSKQVSKRLFRNRIAPLVLLAPLTALLLLLLFGFFYGFLQSFGLLMPGKFAQPFTLEHYQSVLSNNGLFTSICLSVYHSLVSTVIATAFALVLSYALIATGHAGGVVWNVIKFPMFLPWTVTAMIMLDLFGGGGFIASIGEALSFDWLVQFAGLFLYRPSGLGIILAFVWAEVPFITYFVITVMANVSSSLGEAARTMGASSWRAFTNVTLPLCMPVTKNVFLIVAASLFANYEIPLLLGVTRPTGIGVTLYQSYSHASLAGRPEVMAMCMVVLVLTLAFIISFRLLFQRPPAYERGQRKQKRKGGA